MRILVVDDEDGIREGLAAFLRHHGHEVDAAASVAEASAVLARGPFDALVTDWRLGDGTARPLLGRVEPTLVITGWPEEVDAGAARVLAKPVRPDAVLAELRAAAPCARALERDPLAALPGDVRDRVTLLLACCKGRLLALDDDGTFVTATIELPPAAAPIDALLVRLGGDWTIHVGPNGAQRGCWRAYRDGRPAAVEAVIAPGVPWPDGSAPFAIDLAAGTCDPEAFLALAGDVARARAAGREVHLLNVPGHLRLWLELAGRAHQLPMRTCSGPRLSGAQRQLWS